MKFIHTLKENTVNIHTCLRTSACTHVHTHTRQHLQWLVLKRSNVFYFLCGKFPHCGSNPSRSPPPPTSPWCVFREHFCDTFKGLRFMGNIIRQVGSAASAMTGLAYLFLVQILNAILGTFVERVHSFVGTESAIEIKLPLLHHTFFYKL